MVRPALGGYADRAGAWAARGAADMLPPGPGTVDAETQKAMVTQSIRMCHRLLAEAVERGDVEAMAPPPIQAAVAAR